MNRLAVRILEAASFICMALLLSASVVRAQGDAAKNYAAKCATCHGADGKAATPAGKALNARDFHSPDVQAESDATLEQIVANGKNKMPAYGKQLSAAEIKDLVSYCRELGKK
jgi:cytochrome c6